MQYAPTYTNQKFDSHLLDESQTRYVLGRMQYAPTHTDQKFVSTLDDESQIRYVLGRMQYAPTHTDQKFDSHSLDESQTRQVLGCMSLRPIPSRRETLKICMDARKTRRELDENGHIYRKPGGDWTNMVISTENPAGIGRIWSYLSKTRRGLDENGHIYRKPGGDWIQYEYSYRILAEERIPYVSGNHILGKDGIRVTTCMLYLSYIGMQVARIGVNVSRQESRATRGMRSAVCTRQSFTLRFPSLAHSPSLSYC